MLRLALALLTITFPASPWGPAGHHVVAIIAEQRLSPEVREKISKLLEGKYSIADISTCTDQIENTRRILSRKQLRNCPYQQFFRDSQNLRRRSTKTPGPPLPSALP